MEKNETATLESEPQWLHPLLVGPATLVARARDTATIAAVDGVLARLVPDPYIDFMRRYYAQGRERFGLHWSYVDQITLLHAAAVLLRPRRYLEIGVFRGRSFAVVGAAAPDCEMFGFDLWVSGYAGLDNAGPRLVREQLERAGHKGACHITSGDSHETVPRLLAEQSDLYFDLVTVDGDHAEDGARRDLEMVLPRVRVGGAVVFDDLAHPRHPWLERVWDEVVGGLPTFASVKYTELGHGVGVAVRRDPDDEVLAALTGGTEDRVGHLARALTEERAKFAERVQALEWELSGRLEALEKEGGLKGELAKLRRYVLFADADRAERLEVIERQGVELGRIPQLEADIEHLRRQIQTCEDDRAARLTVIERQGTELGRVPQLEAELSHLRQQLQAHADEAARLRGQLESCAAEQAAQRATAERQSADLDDLRTRYAALRRQAEELEGLRGQLGQCLENIRQILGRRVAGVLLPPGRLREIEGLVHEAARQVASTASLAGSTPA